MNNYSTKNEVWKDIKGYEGHYQVSNKGRVKSLERKGVDGRKLQTTILKVGYAENEYPIVVLRKNGKTKTERVHRLVGEAFLSRDCTKNEIDHLDSDKRNNKVENLEWVTRKENMRRAWASGLMEEQRKSAVESGKRRAKQVAKISKTGEVLEVYESQTIAAKKNKVSVPSISMCCNGVRKSVGGYFWKHASEISL